MKSERIPFKFPCMDQTGKDMEEAAVLTLKIILNCVAAVILAGAIYFAWSFGEEYGYWFLLGGIPLAIGLFLHEVKKKKSEPQQKTKEKPEPRKNNSDCREFRNGNVHVRVRFGKDTPQVRVFTKDGCSQDVDFDFDFGDETKKH